MTKIWVVMGGWQYDGEHLVGIFSTQEKAEAFAKKQKARKDASGQNFFDYVEIDEEVMDQEDE